MVEINLRGMVLSKYKTIGEFAAAVGWKRNKASRIINGVQKPDITDIQDMTKALGIDSPEMFMHVFFAPLSTIWTTGDNNEMKQ